MIAGLQYVRPLGKGGFAHVYLYEQDLPRRMVAVKVLDRAVSGEDGLRQAFRSEVDLMAKLSGHPSIVSIYDASITPDGRWYFSMEYCPESLGARAKRAPIDLLTVLDAGVRLAGALETAHRAGVLHRDMKPSNVLLTRSNRPVLSDFGIADLIARDSSEDQRMALSIPWSAPEVVSKRETGTVASEIWSLAATLYTFATSRAPWAMKASKEKNFHEALIKHIERSPYPHIQGAKGYEPFDAVLQQAMQKDPAQRYASMKEFGEALQRLQRQYRFEVTPLDIVEPSGAEHRPEAREGFSWQMPENRSEAEAQVPLTRAQRRQQAGIVEAAPERDRAVAARDTAKAASRRKTVMSVLIGGWVLLALGGVWLYATLVGWL